MTPALLLPNSTKMPSSNDPPSSSVGVAHYDKLRKELRDLISRRKAVEKNLENLEDHMYKFETSYLEDTQNGNIVRGFDNYIKGTVARRRAAIGDADRVFSMSSWTYMKSKEDRASAPPSASVAPDSNNTSAATTPAASSMKAPQVPTSTMLKKSATGGLKRKKKGALASAAAAAAGDEESESHSEMETPVPKRVRISFSGQTTT